MWCVVCVVCCLLCVVWPGDPGGSPHPEPQPEKNSPRSDRHTLLCLECMEPTRARKRGSVVDCHAQRASESRRTTTTSDATTATHVDAERRTALRASLRWLVGWVGCFLACFNSCELSLAETTTSAARIATPTSPTTFYIRLHTVSKDGCCKRQQT